MADPPQKDKPEKASDLQKSVGTKEALRLKARRENHHCLWFGLSIFGIVGWSVVVPTLIGIALGIWIDSRWPGRFSWTLMLLFGGLICGCLNAWYWVDHVSKDD